jgi:hypothetical protein
MAKEITFKFSNLEITLSKLVMHFYDEKTVIPLKKIKSYHLEWHLHEPIFGKKWWFLVLTVDVENAGEDSVPIAFVKFDYTDDKSKMRQHIESRVASAIDLALARPCPPQKKT